MTEHAERDGAPSSESAKSESTVKSGPQTEGLPESFLKMTIADLIMTEEGSQGPAGRRRKRRASEG